MEEHAAEHAEGPLTQFEIKRLIPIEIFGIDASFTNSALFMVIAALAVFLFVTMAMRGSSLVPGRLQALAEAAYMLIASALRVVRPVEDKAILFPAVVLVGIGVLMVFSASAMNSLIKSNDAYSAGVKQLLYALTGGAVMYIFSALDYRRLRPLAPAAMGSVEQNLPTQLGSNRTAI